MQLTNRYNRVIYWRWSLIYDAVSVLFFGKRRRRSMVVADLQPAEGILLIGVGTGADLPLLPQGV